MRAGRRRGVVHQVSFALTLGVAARGTKVQIDVNPLERCLSVVQVVGPVCESSDFLGKQRTLAIAEGDLLARQSMGMRTRLPVLPKAASQS